MTFIYNDFSLKSLGDFTLNCVHYMRMTHVKFSLKNYRSNYNAISGPSVLELPTDSLHSESRQ